jgi:hypothetical protein
MQQADLKPCWFFVDEAGDPNFYAKRSKRLIVGEEGCSRTLILGFVRAADPQQLRSKLSDVRVEIAGSKYLRDIPSISKSLAQFHAKDDCAEVRKMVFEVIERMDFAAQFIVARKREHIFQNKYDGKCSAFYDDLIRMLFRGQLHLATENHIVFARRGNRARQHQLRSAVELSIRDFERNYHNSDETTVNVNTSQPAQEPVLQVIDYMNWAVQRAFERSEMRYFEFLRGKIEKVWDVYDIHKLQSNGNVVYDRKRNPFDIRKASPLS